MVREKGEVNYFIPKAMGKALDEILEVEGGKHAIKSRSQLIQILLSDFIGYYQHDKFFKAKVASKAFLNESEERIKERRMKNNHQRSRS